VREQYGGAQSDQALARTVADFKINRYDASSGTLGFSAAQATGFDRLQAEHQQFFAAPTTVNGLRPGAITDPNEVRRLTAFFAWSAWSASATRPGQAYSYTPTTGRPSRWSITSPPPTMLCGASSPWPRYSAVSARCSPLLAAGTSSAGMAVNSAA
jgi:nitric oxide reductase large subunit